MQQVPEVSPFTFVFQSIAHEQHAEQNEDTVLLDPHHGLAAIFDGMGSRKGADAERPPQLRVRYPKTTGVLVVFCHHKDEDGYTMVSAHVGDSRIYLLREHASLVRLTQDDGLLTTLIQSQTISQTDALRIDQASDASQLSEAELEYFNKRYGVTQMLGDEQPPVIHVQQTPLLPGDRILLCSDGIHDNLLDQEIEALLRNGASTTVANLLVESAVQRSHQDSTTTIRAKLDDMSALVVTYHHRDPEIEVI